MFTLYMFNFEKQITTMGVNGGMLAMNDDGYISPIIKKLYIAYINKQLTQKLVNEELKKLK
jgi:hypothetical protein